jgi:hypothetical protein
MEGRLAEKKRRYGEPHLGTCQKKSDGENKLIIHYIMHSPHHLSHTIHRLLSIISSATLQQKTL